MTNYPKTMKKNNHYPQPHRHDWVWWAYLILLCVLFALFLCSCKRVEYVTQEKVVYHTDTLRQTLVQRDSIYLHDSIAYKEFVKGDTVRIESEKWHTRYVDKVKHDTTYVAKVDTAYVSKTEVKEVPREKKWWESALQWVGLLTLIGGGIWIYHKLKK